MLKTVTYASARPGPKLLILGAIHGNEKCGTEAMNRMITEIDAGRFSILCGRATFIPICNPRAFIEDKRFIERNLNRYLVPMETPDTYEAKLGNILCPILETSDAVLDIHSYTIGGEPFISYRGDTANERAFAAAIGVPTLLTGWDNVYALMGRGLALSKDEATGGPQYARRFGAVAITLECGQHKDPKAPEVAYQGILNALEYFGMLGGGKADAAEPPRLRHVEMTHVFYRGEAGQLPKNWNHLEAVAKGEIIARYPDGKSIPAPDDGFIIMPKANCPIGDEWFYFGIEKPQTT